MQHAPRKPNRATPVGRPRGGPSTASGRQRSGAWRARIVLLALLAIATPSDAHQEDTSYTRVVVDERTVTTEVTFDLHVLGRIAVVDLDGDQIVTDDELRTAAPVVQAYLAERLHLSLEDGPPSLGAPRAPEWADGADTAPVTRVDWPQTLVDFRFSRSTDGHPRLVTLVYDTWDELGGSHTNLTSIEQPGYDPLEVVFTAEEPDYDYYTEAPASPWSQFGRFVRLGAEHIWEGFDHILFLVALLVVSRLRELLQIVTAFTAAHSITLGLAALEIVVLPPPIIEAGIAATIVWVAWQNLRGRRGAHRWRLTFAFGLVHGFGFANVLRDLELPAAGLVRALAGFNIGVELGQVAIVAVLWPGFALLARTRLGAPAVTGVSAAVGIAGLVWLVERAAPLLGATGG